MCVLDLSEFTLHRVHRKKWLFTYLQNHVDYLLFSEMQIKNLSLAHDPLGYIYPLLLRLCFVLIFVAVRSLTTSSPNPKMIQQVRLYIF